jgi:hypothetical protein
MEATVKNPTLLLVFAAVLAVSLTWGGCDDDGHKAPPAPGTVEGKITRLVPAPVTPPSPVLAGQSASSEAAGDAAASAHSGVDLADGPSIEPVTDAHVVLVDAENLTVATEIIRTDPQGMYKFGGLPPGEYSALVLHESLAVRERSAPTIEIKSNKLTTYDINMTPFELFANRRYHIAGIVTDAVTGDPIAGAHVGAAIAIDGELAAYLGGVGTFWATVTDSSGEYYVPALSLSLPTAEGLVPLTVTKEGYESNTVIGDGPSIPEVIPPTYPLPTGGELTLQVDIGLEPICFDGDQFCNAGSIKGRLIAYGEPVEDVIVGATLASVADPDTFRAPPASFVPVPGKTTYTDREGDFLIEGLTPGEYWIDPAFRETDGYVFDPYTEPFGTRCIVVEGETCNLGTLQLMRAISPVTPVNRATIQDTTPEFRWTEAVVPSGMEFKGYNVMFGTGYIMETQVEAIMETHWQMPDSMAFTPGDYVRWNVAARMYNPGTRRFITIGEFEWPATFNIEE